MSGVRRPGSRGVPNAPTRAAYLASVGQCRDRLRADGVELDAYDSAANAEDLDELRVALGYDRWNVLGLSNGGLATLTLMRLHPEGIRSVVSTRRAATTTCGSWIDGGRRIGCSKRSSSTVLPIWLVMDNSRASLRLLRADRCVAAESGRRVSTDPAGGPELTAHATGDVFLAATARLIQNPTALPSFPATIFFAAHGGLAPVVRAAVGTPTPLSDVFAYGKTLSTLCSDIIPFETRDDRTEAARAIPEFSTLILAPTRWRRSTGRPAPSGACRVPRRFSTIRFSVGSRR